MLTLVNPALEEGRPEGCANPVFSCELSDDWCNGLETLVAGGNRDEVFHNDNDDDDTNMVPSVCSAFSREAHKTGERLGSAP